jgi:hypothetical protein
MEFVRGINPHAYLGRQKEELERNKTEMTHEYVMTKKERREYDDEQSCEKALNHSAKEAVERVATENEERRPMF